MVRYIHGMASESNRSPASATVRVARIITRLNIGGPSIQATKLTARLAPGGFETLLIYGQLGAGEGDMSYLLEPGTIQPLHVPTLRRPVSPLNDALTCLSIFRALCRFRPAIVHTHMAKAGLTGRLAAIAYNLTRGRRARARLVHTYHGHVFDGYFSKRTTQVFLTTERFLARWTDVLIAISVQIRHELLSEYHIGRPEQVQIVPLGLDLSSFETVDREASERARGGLDVPATAVTITLVGRLTVIKQPGLFLEMARLVHTRHPEALFLLVGDGELRSHLERQREELGLQDSVRFLGWRRDLATIYAATDVFVLSSRNEGTPVALIEALAAGVPSVCTDVGGVRDVLTDPACGVIVSAQTAEALADAVCGIVEGGKSRLDSGHPARQSIVARFSFDRLAGDLATMYRGLLTPETSGTTRSSREDPLRV